VVDGNARLDDFWTRVEAQGAPLIEALPDEPAAQLVTFVFRGSSPALPLRFYQCIGLFEQGARYFDDAPEQLGINRRMRDVLRASGYELGYRECAGGHDYAGWELCLPEGLEVLLGG
jgi:enterochelin esterase family protein